MRSRDLIIGGGLILIGGLFLLETLDIVSINVWGVIWALALIGAGLWMLGWIKYDRDHASTEEVSVPIEGAASASVSIRHAGGRLEIAGGAGPEELLSGNISGGVSYRRKTSDGKVDLSVEAPGRVYVVLPFVQPHDWSLKLNEQIPLELDFRTGGNESRIDLSQLKVSDLRINTGASETSITLPSNVPYTRAQVKGGAASVKVTIPEGVAARINATGAMSSVSVDRDRFPKSGGYFRSVDFDEAQFKVELDLSMGVGSISVK